MLEVEGLKLYYKTLKGYVKAVDDVSFTVNDGELLGLAGGIMGVANLHWEMV